MYPFFLKHFTFILLLFCAFQSVNAQKINQFDANNQRTGVWRKFYPNKKIRYEGTFKAGKEVGIFNFYDESSSLHPIAIKEFKETTDSVLTKFYTIKGVLQSQGNFIGKNREGKWIYFFADGKKMSIEYYKNNLLNGLLTNYYPNDYVAEETNFLMGLKHGLSSKYTSDGILIEAVNYQKNILEGEAKYYDLKGNLKEKGIYKNGQKFGKWEFYLDGELTEKKKNKV
ncbi:MAG: toxin-antitoxin system YwqK family antitoxin [Polaribacter sp.]|nr:toxin-antitoxin system YwqK family antitoxin [Polaribacter sp.]